MSLNLKYKSTHKASPPPHKSKRKSTTAVYTILHIPEHKFTLRHTILPPKQKWRLFALLSVSILLLWLPVLSNLGRACVHWGWNPGCANLHHQHCRGAEAPALPLPTHVVSCSAFSSEDLSYNRSLGTTITLTKLSFLSFHFWLPNTATFLLVPVYMYYYTINISAISVNANTV